MEEVIGIPVDNIEETMSDEMQNLIFIKDRKVVFNAAGSSYTLGYRFVFEYKANDRYKALQSKDNPQFAVEKTDEWMELTYISNK
ncbi:hypothetical protein D3C78_867840 [compost metagenome]